MSARASRHPASNPRRSRRRRHDGGEARGLIRGFAVALILAAIAVIAVRSYNGVPLRDYKTMYVTLPAVGNLRSHDPVRVAGARVGQVIDLRIASNGRARVRLQLEPDAPPLPADTRVSVRAAGLIGARYLELAPGDSDRILAEGSTIRAGDDALTFGVPEMLDTFDVETRGGLQQMVTELGTGMLGRGEQLNGAIRVGSTTQQPFQAFVESVLSRPGAARRLFPSLDEMATAFAASGEDFARMFSPAATALEPFVDRRRSMRAALDTAPSALSSAEAGLAKGRRLLGATRALATATNATFPLAPAALRATTGLLRASHDPLRRTSVLMRAARPAMPATLRIISALSPVLDLARAGFDDLAPIVTELGRYGCDIRNLGVVMRSETGMSSSPGGELGPLGALRLQLIVPPLETTGTTDSSVIRPGYVPPCTFLGGPYPAVQPGGPGR